MVRPATPLHLSQLLALGQRCCRYTPSPDYSLPDSGSPTFVDFGYNNITFPAPQQQLQHYKSAYNMRFGGIRKPRLGNRRVQGALLLLAAHTGSSFSLVDAKAKGWLVGQGGVANTSASTRNLNYSLADVRSMYDGVPASSSWRNVSRVTLGTCTLSRTRTLSRMAWTFGGTTRARQCTCHRDCFHNLISVLNHAPCAGTSRFTGGM